jgi:hypothetical protein
MAASTSKEDFENGERELKSWALNKNGARRLDVYLREVRVEFDPRIITAVEMLAHIALVLDHLNSHGTAKFLPFIEPNEPIFVTVSEEPMY